MLEEATKKDNRNLILRLKALFGDSIVQENKPDSTGPKPKFVVWIVFSMKVLSGIIGSYFTEIFQSSNQQIEANSLYPFLMWS